MRTIRSVMVLFFLLFLFLDASAASNPARSVSTPKEDWHPHINRREAVPEELKIFVLDVGQGDAIFIEFPHGETMLIDAGSWDGYGIPHLSHFLENYFQVNSFKKKTIDMIVVSHPDFDHISGLKEIIDGYWVNWFIDSGRAGSRKTYSELMTDVKFKDEENRFDYIAITEKADGFKKDGFFKLDDILDFEDCDCFLLSSYRGKGWQDPNNASISVKIKCGRSSALFMGDAEGKNKLDEDKYIKVDLNSWSENRIYKRLKGLEHQKLLDSDLIKTGHHGTDKAASELFLKAVSPKVSVISTGDYRISEKAKKYGHPRAAHLQRLEKYTSGTSAGKRRIRAFETHAKKVTLEITKDIFLTGPEHELKKNYSPGASGTQSIKEYGDILLILRDGVVRKVSKDDPEYMKYFPVQSILKYSDD